MTCIVGLIDKEKKNVIIGSDSAGMSEYDLVVRKDPKVFKVGDFLIGCAGSFRMMQLLRFSLELPEIKNKEIYEYLCVDFINSVRECFRQGGYLQRTTDGDDKGGYFLVGYKNRLFDINSDFQVGENKSGMDALGTGRQYALGSLHADSNSVYFPKERVQRALQAASYFSSAVCKPFLVKTT